MVLRDLFLRLIASSERKLAQNWTVVHGRMEWEICTSRCATMTSLLQYHIPLILAMDNRVELPRPLIVDLHLQDEEQHNPTLPQTLYFPNTVQKTILITM